MDSISRQDAIDAIKTMPIVEAMGVISTLSSTQRKGKWMEHYCDEDGYVDGIECSCCHEWWYMGGNLPNFCPNCGAKMEEQK